MTKEQKIEAYSMRLDGATLQEIADVFGVTREYIRQILPGTSQNTHAKKWPKGCIYPNIGNWMYQNRHSYNSLAQLCEVHSLTIRRAMTGRTITTKNLIDKIIAVTGMTYEEAFSTKCKEETIY